MSRIAGHDEAAVAAAGLRLAARQRHVDVADLVDLKALADRLDAAERLEQRAQPIAGNAEDLDVDVLRLAAEQPVADPAADDQRAAAGVARRRVAMSRATIDGPWRAEAPSPLCASGSVLRPKRFTTRSVKPGATR